MSQLPMPEQYCSVCDRPVEEVRWEATLVRTRLHVTGGIVVPPEPWGERVISMAPGVYQALPCGHQIEEKQALVFATEWERLNGLRP